MWIRMKGNLGNDWPEPWKNGEAHNAPEPLALRLIARNLADAAPELEVPPEVTREAAVMVPAGESEPPPAPTGYDAMTKAQLKVIAEKRGLPATGNKAELIQMLAEDDATRPGFDGVDYASLDKEALHELAGKRGLLVSGTKEELIDRLKEDDAKGE